MEWAKSSREDGFSLLELLVALTILALAMSVVSISAAGRRSTFEIQRLSGEASSLFREARLSAQTSGRPARVVFDPDVRELRHTESAKVVVPDGITADLTSAASAGPSAIIFFPDGSSSGGALTFKTEDRSETVRVDWLTSRIDRVEIAE